MSATGLVTPDDTTASSPDASAWSLPDHDPGVARYEIIGPRGAPVVAVLGGVSASRHVASSALDSSTGWWEDVVGQGRAIDTWKFRVLSID